MCTCIFKTKLWSCIVLISHTTYIYPSILLHHLLSFTTLAVMHNTFQRDLCRLKLETARAFAKVVSSSLAPIASSQDAALKISAQVQGLGPLFQLTISVQNTSPSATVTNHFITFKCDESLYRINRKLIQVCPVGLAVLYSGSIT